MKVIIAEKVLAANCGIERAVRVVIEEHNLTVLAANCGIESYEIFERLELLKLF